MNVMTKREPSPRSRADSFQSSHGDSDHLAIEGTPFRRLFTLLALRTTAHFYKPDGFVRQISPNLVVKTGPWVHLTEAASMNFVSKNTSVPVPQIYCSFIHKHRAYIVMKRIQGDELALAWPILSEAERAGIIAQLHDMMRELRSLTPSDEHIKSCTGGSLYDSRIPHARSRFGPFQSAQEFHCWLRQDFSLGNYMDCKAHDDYDSLEAMIIKQDGPWPSPVYTHGDLNPSNILVRKSKVVGIIDWEFSGWYPPYWEFTTTWYGNRMRKWWQDLLDRFLPKSSDELKMEITRQKWWGEF